MTSSPLNQYSLSIQPILFILGASVSMLRQSARGMAVVGNSQAVEYFFAFLNPSAVEDYADKRRIRERDVKKK